MPYVAATCCLLSLTFGRIQAHPISYSPGRGIHVASPSGDRGDLSWSREEKGRSQSSTNSEEGAKPRGAKMGRKVEA